MINEPYDIFNLPTKGIFYKNRVSSLKVKYICAIDEDTLNSRELMMNNMVWETLYDLKVINKDELRFDELLSIDKLALMIFFRKNAYGSIFSIEVTDPYTKQNIDVEIDLDKVLEQGEYNFENLNFDERGEFTFEMPASKKKIKFRLLSAKEEDEAEKIAENLKNVLKLKTAPYIMQKNIMSIMEIDGERDKIKIKTTLENSKMSLIDTSEFRKYYSKIEPSLNLDYEVLSPTKKTFKIKVPLNFGFFFPTFGL